MVTKVWSHYSAPGCAFKKLSTGMKITQIFAYHHPPAPRLPAVRARRHRCGPKARGQGGVESEKGVGAIAIVYNNIQ
jgi:hypothetical protein